MPIMWVCRVNTVGDFFLLTSRARGVGMGDALPTGPLIRKGVP